MCCGEVKPGKSQKWWAQRHLNVGFMVGVLLLLLTYLAVSQQFAISATYVVIAEAQRITGKQLIKAPNETDKGKVVCETEGRFSESCEIDGDVRTNGTALSVVIVPTRWSEHREWRINPYSRRRVTSFKKVTVTQLQDQAAAPPCTVTYNMPAVLLALGGNTGNYWHDHSDVLIPLFVASRRYDGEVQFLVHNMQERPQWLGKYKALLQRLSKYDAVDLDGDAHVRCFPHITVGLRMDKEFSIDPELAPGRLSMADFTRFQRETYALPRHAAVSLTREPDKKPRLLLIHRGHNRKFVNEQEIVQAAEAAGFEAVAMELRGDKDIGDQARVVNSFDALLGVHGAGLTNAVFLPPGAVLIQVIPYGKMEFISRSEFSEPVADMGLKYLDYSVTVEESTLLEMLGPDHPAIRDPESIHRSGWLQVFDFYLNKQDVRINVTSFAPTLAQALDHLRQR
ncbi:beta-1,2-xylosyltransferase XYXT1-like [Phragmites australis]|uniref:beta-1,2-xylosyltransferase XYXT1-like n=1 Tax=Phragmites australis TaxID=29695 RepID=UPI002D77D563|nr:beta-1,2-xylosyltransferase XYXT1-like [Phragmites australis]